MQLFPNDNSEENKKYYDITLTNSIWDKKKTILIIFDDVTMNIYGMEALKQMNDYKNKVLATVGHEFKTPLNIIMILLDALELSMDITEIKKKMGIIKINS